MTLDIPVNGDVPVVSVGVWQSEQPIEAKRAAPFWVELVDVPGVGGADKRLKIAKFRRSDAISEAVPIDVPKFGLLEFPFRKGVLSSGELLNTHPVTALRSLGNTSLETPCSTLYASPTNSKQRFVLSFPAETRDGAIVAAGIECAAYFQRGSGRRSRVETGLQRGIRSRFHQSETVQRRRNAEDHVGSVDRSDEVRLRQIAAAPRRSGP